MGNVSLLNQIKVSPQKKISTVGGDVWHALKSTEESFYGFGEAYFSWIKYKAVKAWKQHLRMTINIIVPIGRVRCIFHDLQNNLFREEYIGLTSYNRLTIPPGILYGFQGVSKGSSLILNIANLPHDPEEINRISLEMIEFNWNN